jgi:hypothetical protein
MAVGHRSSAVVGWIVGQASQYWGWPVAPGCGGAHGVGDEAGGRPERSDHGVAPDGRRNSATVLREESWWPVSWWAIAQGSGHGDAVVTLGRSRRRLSTVARWSGAAVRRGLEQRHRVERGEN